MSTLIQQPILCAEGPIRDTCDIGYRWTCEVCGNYEDEDVTPNVFAVFDADVAAPGLYRILARPFYSQPLIGGGAKLFEDCIERIGDLSPGVTGGDAPCAMLCGTCEAKYSTQNGGLNEEA